MQEVFDSALAKKQRVRNLIANSTKEVRDRSSAPDVNISVFEDGGKVNTFFRKNDVLNPVNTWESGVQNGVSLDVIMSTERVFLSGVRKLYITALQQSEGLTDASKQGIIENSFAGRKTKNASIKNLREAKRQIRSGEDKALVFMKRVGF